jgi:5-methylcytosine-specific restriction endonuclease McrA
MAGDGRGTRRWREHSLAHLLGTPPCAYCGTRPATSVDHIHPVSKGGLMWDCANHAPACGKCNSAKKDRVWSTRPNSARTEVETDSDRSATESRWPSSATQSDGDLLGGPREEQAG